ncbi:HAD-IIB family hydrolase [Bifidobacterium leontopitheci]|uniref:HAD-IIB family hydrolase n=1 Tax=Bifidobacterium leontopitheci TaxID=2650774 RepID=UPI001D028642|nr:HAD-IIB family hydrolase [Bifidobacterium leontopitheci]
MCAWDAPDAAVDPDAVDAFAFDLDNTLAVSKQPMKPDMTACLAALLRYRPVAVITGGSFALASSQVIAMLDGQADLAGLHVMPTSGSSYYVWDGGAWVVRYERTLSQPDRDAAAASLRRRAEELGLWPERPLGEPIEDRGSQITFSALGQLAPAGAKQQWDPDGTKKARLVAAVAADLPHLLVRAGGYTSVDVSAGADKSFAVRELAKALGTSVGRIVFVGDRMTPGGNDYPAACAGTFAVAVTCPQDTVRWCRGAIAVLEGRSRGTSDVT